MTYLLSCGWYHRQPHVLPTMLATPELAPAVAAFLALQSQGYDWCALTPVALAVVNAGEDTLPTVGLYLAS